MEFDRLKLALSDGYVIQGEIGAGGMATVYLAEDVKHGRQVAVKVLHPNLAASLGSERFLREIEIASRLQHPHILMLIDSGEADGLLYYVMPYVEGESLRDRIGREGQLPLEDALNVTRDVASALAYAHSHGVVHRDVKPENIMLTGGHAVVTDFGIARALGAAGADRLTETGITIGTPHYMSPEQATGGEVDGRSDLYSLACVLYEMLVGEPPFSGPTAVAVIARHSMESVPSIRIVRPSVPEAVEGAVMKAMAKIPADRFATVQMFAEALAAPQASGVGFSASAPAASQRGPRAWWKTAAGIAAAILIVVAGTIGIVRRWPAPGAPLAPDRVVVGLLENQTGNAALDVVGAMAADWITLGLQKTGLVDVVPSPTALQSSRYVAAAAALGDISDPVLALARETGAGMVISGRIYPQGDSIQLLVQVTAAARGEPLGPVDPVVGPASSPMEAIEQLRQRVMGLLAVSLDTRLSERVSFQGSPPSFEAYRAFSEGMEHYIRNEWRRAVDRFNEAFELDGTFVVAVLYAALSYANLNDRATADSLAAIVTARDEELSDYHRWWGRYLRARYAGDNEAALAAIEQAVEIAPNSKAAYNLAYLATETNRPQRAVAALRSLDPERGPMRGWFPYWSVLTDALHRSGEHETELAAARRARALHPDRPMALQYEGEALAALGRLADVRRVAGEIAAWGEADPSPGAMIDRIAFELKAHGHDRPAEELFDFAVERIAADTLGGATEAQLNDLAAVLDDAGRIDEAQAIVSRLVQRDHDAYRPWLGTLAAWRRDTTTALAAAAWMESLDEPYRFGFYTRQRARVAAALGDGGEAVRLLEQAFREGQGYPRHLDRNFDRVAGYEPLQRLMEPRP